MNDKLPVNGLEIKAAAYIKEMGYDAKDCSIWQDHGAIELETKSAEAVDCKCNVGDVIKVKGYLSTFGNIDREGDIVATDAFDDSLKNQVKFPLQRNHNYGTQDQMGSFTAQADKKGLLIDGEIVVTPDNMHEAMLIKSGQLNTLSMGGLFKYSDTLTKSGNNMIEKVALFEGSVVSIPANPKAVFTVKSLIEKSQQVDNTKADGQVSQDELDDQKLKKYMRELRKLLEV